jgi:CubicO group peptidase (beta-lactamase class C family)
VTIDYPMLARVDAAEAGLDPAAFEALDAFVASGTGAGGASPRLYAGAVLLVAHQARIVHEAAVGHAQTHEGTQPLAEPREMRTNTIFDLGSITKVAATTAAVMKLVDEGVLRLDDAIGRHLPEVGREKSEITVRQLLTHRSGLWEWQPTYLHARGPGKALRFVAEVRLRYGIGDGRHYSDLGFMLLGVIVERVTGRSLDDYVRREIHEPLGMTDAWFAPDPALRGRIAATSLGNPYERRMIATGSPYPVDGDPDDFDGWRDSTLVGEVNDGNTWYAWGGVAGHAGLFSTAGDLAAFGQALCNGGGYGGARLASADTVSAFLTEPYDPGQAIGFESRRLPGSATVPVREGGFGHGGFTGTELLFDPSRDLVVVLLTNRQHPGEPYGSLEPVWDGVLRRVLAALPSG